MCEMTATHGPWEAIRKIVGGLAGSARTWRPWKLPEGAEAGPVDADLDARVAASALLLEAAHADGEVTAAERRYIECTLRREFGLGPTDARALLRSAESIRATTPDAWHYTNVAMEHLSVGQRILLSDLMRRVVHLDGDPTGEEEYVLRRVSSLLRLEPEHV